MFGLSLSPLSTGLGAISGAIVVAVGLFAYDGLIDDPNIRKTEQDACTIRTMDAANRAEAAERARQKAISDAALDAYNAALAAQELARRGVEARFEQELSDYERQLVEAGRSCPLSLDDLDWLRKQ